MPKDGPIIITDFPRPFWEKKGLIWAPYYSDTETERMICVTPEAAYIGATYALGAIKRKVVPFIFQALKSREAEGQAKNHG